MIDAQAQGKKKRNEFLKEEEEVICFSIVFMNTVGAHTSKTSRQEHQKGR